MLCCSFASFGPKFRHSLKGPWLKQSLSLPPPPLRAKGDSLCVLPSLYICSCTPFPVSFSQGNSLPLLATVYFRPLQFAAVFKSHTCVCFCQAHMLYALISYRYNDATKCFKIPSHFLSISLIFFESSILDVKVLYVRSSAVYVARKRREREREEGWQCCPLPDILGPLLSTLARGSFCQTRRQTLCVCLPELPHERPKLWQKFAFAWGPLRLPEGFFVIFLKGFCC